MPVLSVEKTAKILENNLRKALVEANAQTVHVNLSGGIDSALLLAVCTRVVGPENVTCAFIGFKSDPKARHRASMYAQSLNVHMIDLDLTHDFNSILETIVDQAAPNVGVAEENRLFNKMHENPLIAGSFRSCLRAPIARFINRLLGVNGLVMGTGNECEDRILRFYQKGGDGEVDNNILANFTKGEVYQLAQYYRVSRDILNATPSPDLWGIGDKHSDESEYFSYLKIVPEEITEENYPVIRAYSYVDIVDEATYTPDCAKYRNVGLIERVSRFLDTPLYGDFVGYTTVWDYMVAGNPMSRMYSLARESQSFVGIKADWIVRILDSFQRCEKLTRNKWNPNCPTYSTRREYLDAGALTNTFTSV